MSDKQESALLIYNRNKVYVESNIDDLSIQALCQYARTQDELYLASLGEVLKKRQP